jgi:hypothetical protein
VREISFARFTAVGAPDWVSPWVEPGFRVHDVVASWNAELPPRAWLELRVQGRDGGAETPWYELGVWAPGEDVVRRSSVPGQDDGRCRVDVDTLVAPGGLTAFRLSAGVRGDGAGARVRLVAAVAAGLPATSLPGPPASTLALELDVPPFSQLVHRGDHPEYDGGGASWCSAASTAMLVAFWGRGPTPAETAWAGAGHPDPWVDHAARATYDAAYAGCGNWSFNVAYAATFGLEAFVTRLRSLREAELFLAAGIPLALSVAAAPGELDGFTAAGSAGHLVVLTGVTAAGDPVVNDPAAETNADVRRVYPRAQLERAWLRGSGGAVYVVRPASAPLPDGGGPW